MDTIYNDKGCFYRALDDEPIFVLLARDPCAAEAIRWWVTLRQALIGRGQKPLEDHEMLGDALATAAAAVVWRSDATDPATYGQTPRWKVEEVPSRELVEVGLADKLRERLLTNANRFYAYAANHFRKDNHESWAKGEVNWTEYLANIELLGLEPALKPSGGSKAAHDHFEREETISEAQRHTVGTIKGLLGEAPNLDTLVDLPPEEGRPDAILRKRLENYRDEDRVTMSAGVLRKVLRATPFVAVDLAAKIAKGLRQITDQYVPEVKSTTWPHTRKNKMLAYADRINGFAAELEEGSIIGKSLQTRMPGKSPLLGEPYRGKRSTIPGVPDLDPYAAMAEHMHGGFEPDSPAAIIASIGKATGTAFDPATETMRAPSDTTDVTAVPDLPPHRFAMFDKGHERAYGRGLEISPSHIPAMLDRMEADGWHLVAALGVEASKVGMLFYRREFSAFERAHGFGEPFEPTPVRDTKPVEWPQQRFLGTYEGFGVWLDLKAPDHVQRCVRSLLNGTCGPDGLGNGMEP